VRERLRDALGSVGELEEAGRRIDDPPGGRAAAGSRSPLPRELFIEPRLLEVAAKAGRPVARKAWLRHARSALHRRDEDPSPVR